uniref:Structure-specific endonuclease subunit SLX1 homolog n=1 Tax=Syphacia muris TaxID=451379 RepID=A0A0N5AIJ8_9BILA
MVCIIHGFPNSISALRFEWAWQNPEKSRRLRQLNLRKKPKESPFAFRIRIACHMLNSDPWKRLALTFRWLLPAETIPFPPPALPPHVRVAQGLVEKTIIPVSEDDNDYEIVQKCFLCMKPIKFLTGLIRCTANKCGSHFHCQCIAKSFLKLSNEINYHLFPIIGNCPNCKASLLWGDLVRDQRSIIAVVSAAGKPKEGDSLEIPKYLNKFL